MFAGCLKLEYFLDVVKRAAFGFGIDLPDISADNAHRDEDEAADNPDGEHERSPTWLHLAEQYLIAYITGNAEGYNQEQNADVVDGIQRAHREGRNAVEGESQHLMEGVF